MLLQYNSGTTDLYIQNLRLSFHVPFEYLLQKPKAFSVILRMDHNKKKSF